MVYTLTVHLTAKSDPECIRKLKNKLIEASRIYSKDKETVSSFIAMHQVISISSHAHFTQVSWLVMQSVFDSREFTIVERYEKESSQQYHLSNPYWKTFDPYVLPLLEKPMDLRRYEELDTSKDVQVD
jgi:quinol monooxygenase YgiN